MDYKFSIRLPDIAGNIKVKRLVYKTYSGRVSMYIASRIDRGGLQFLFSNF